MKRAHVTARLPARIAAAACGAAGTAGLALLMRFPPARYSFYPRCPVSEYLHLLCPGCGATRALAALLHGHPKQALHFNALFVVVLPILTAYAALCGYRAWTADEFRWPEPPRWTLQTGLVLALLFTISRNLPR